MAPAIEVRELHKLYGSFAAVQGLSLTVEPGEIVAILGPNGAGKTTTLEILAGFRERTSGSVSVLGVDPHLADEHWRARIGIVLQECGFESFLSVRELLSLYGSYYPTQRAVDDVLNVVSLTSKADARIGSLSGGQRRRVDVALAIIGDPELIFLDEPTTGLDPVARQETWAAFRQLAVDGRTVLLTTHYLDEAEQLADRIIVIANGQVLTEGTTNDVIRAAGLEQVMRFQTPAVSPEILDELVDVLKPRLRITGTHWEVDLTNRATHLLAYVTSWAHHHGVELDLTVSRPSLEDAYLELIARAKKASGTPTDDLSVS
jgi:ABC-2 type transport system ATP-binding protein